MKRNTDVVVADNLLNPDAAPAVFGATVGNFSKALKKILVNGWNEKEVVSCYYNEVDNENYYEIGMNHGFIEDQVVEVSNVTPESYNGKWKVERVDSNGVYVKTDLASASAGAPLDTAISMQIKCASAGWTLTTENADESVVIVKNKSGKEFIIENEEHCSLGYDDTPTSNYVHIDSYDNYQAIRIQHVKNVVDTTNYELLTYRGWLSGDDAYKGGTVVAYSRENETDYHYDRDYRKADKIKYTVLADGYSFHLISSRSKTGAFNTRTWGFYGELKNSLFGAVLIGGTSSSRSDAGGSSEEGYQSGEMVYSNSSNDRRVYSTISQDAPTEYLISETYLSSTDITENTKMVIEEDIAVIDSNSNIVQGKLPGVAQFKRNNNFPEGIRLTENKEERLNNYTIVKIGTGRMSDYDYSVLFDTRGPWR